MKYSVDVNPLKNASGLPTEVWRWSAADSANQIRLKSISSEEVTLSTYSRLDETNPEPNAVVFIDRDVSKNTSPRRRSARRLLGTCIAMKLDMKVFYAERCPYEKTAWLKGVKPMRNKEMG